MSTAHKTYFLYVSNCLLTVLRQQQPIVKSHVLTQRIPLLPDRWCVVQGVWWMMYSSSRRLYYVYVM